MRMWRKPLITAYQSRAFQKRHAVPFSAAFQQPAARLSVQGNNSQSSAYNGPKRPGPQAGGAQRRSNSPREQAPEVIGGAAASERALPHQGQNGESGNRNKNGKGKTAVDIDRKHVLIACAITGAVLGVVLAVLQAVGPFATSDLHGMPTGASRSTGFMLAMAPLLAAWGFTIHLRCSDALIARYLKANAALCVAWLLIVTLKYPTGNDHLVSIMWYLYYVPMLLTSTFSLFSAMRASALDRIPATSYAKRAVLAIDAALIALVLTNNLHHVVFRFSFDDPLWSGSYTYGPGYWLVLGWIITQIVLFFACSFAAARRQLRSAFVPMALIVGVLGTYTVLYILRFLIGSNLALVYSILLISCLEIALDLGILPSYYWRESMFSALPFNLRILSRTGEVALHTAQFRPSESDDALHSMFLQSNLPRRSISSFRTTAVPHTLFRGYNVTGGSALLAEDVTAIDDRRETLEQQQDSLRAHNELLKHRHAIDSVLYRTQQERALVDEIEQTLAAKTRRIDELLSDLPRGSDPQSLAKRRERLTEVKLLIAYCKRKGGLVLAGKSDPAFNRERLQLVFNETAADLRTLGIDCAALVDVKRVLPASTVSVLYDCLYDFAAAAFAASNLILMLFVSDKTEAGEGEGEGSGDGRRRVVEMRAALEAGGSSQSKGYTRSLEELRRVLERRNVRFALDITPDGATLAVQVSEDEGVA